MSIHFKTSTFAHSSIYRIVVVLHLTVFQLPRSRVEAPVLLQQLIRRCGRGLGLLGLGRGDGRWGAAASEFAWPGRWLGTVGICWDLGCGVVWQGVMWLSFGMILSDTVKYDLFTARLVGISSSNHVTHDKTMRIPGRTWSWTKKKGWRHWENWTSRAIVGLFKVTWLKPCAVQMIGQLSCQDEPDEPHVLFIYVKDITPKRPLNNGFRAAYFRTNYD